LVSVAQPLRAMGYQAMHAAEQLVRGEDLPAAGPIIHTLTTGGTISPPTTTR
jgi:DNA-binding LacI/PurR family transcriptional regulator